MCCQYLAECKMQGVASQPIDSLRLDFSKNLGNPYTPVGNYAKFGEGTRIWRQHQITATFSRQKYFKYPGFKHKYKYEYKYFDLKYKYSGHIEQVGLHVGTTRTRKYLFLLQLRLNKGCIFHWLRSATQALI